MLAGNAVHRTSDFRSRGHKFELQLGLITFMEIAHEIISMVTLPPLLVQGWQFVRFFFFFFFFYDLGFTDLSRIFHLYQADRSSKVLMKDVHKVWVLFYQ